MGDQGYTTFKAETKGAVLTVNFDYPPVNVQGIPMLDDLNKLAETLEDDRNVKVVVFQSAHPEIFVAHADTNFLKEMSTTAVSRDEVELLYLQTTLECISKLTQATSQTPAIKRFAVADEKGFENDIENQRNWNNAVIGIQEIK